MLKRGRTKKACFISCLLLLGAVGSAQYPTRPSGKEQGAAFRWPEGKQVALTLSFDDGRSSQIDNGLPILNRHQAKATFFVNPSNLQPRLELWRAVPGQGHEIGNHTMSHPCTGNFPWSRDNALEDYSLERISREMETANTEIQRIFGVRVRSFAYPCGQKYVGRGERVQSYVPLVAKKFLAGRGWLGEAANDPAVCDLSQLLGMELDGLSFPEARAIVEQAKTVGHWVVFCGHDIGESGRQTTLTPTLEALCQYGKDPANGVWLATLEEIAAYVAGQREGHSSSK